MGSTGESSTDDGGAAVRDEPDRARYAAYDDDDDQPVAILTYRHKGDGLALLHTEVREDVRGRGLANSIARFALDSAREAGVQVMPTCRFVVTFLRRNPDYRSIVHPDYLERVFG